MKSLLALKKELYDLGNKEKAALSMRFFKTEKGQYGAGDMFLGISVPNQRKIAKKYQNLPLGDLHNLLMSKEHEFRLTALHILVLQYEKGEKNVHQTLVDFYLAHTERINNWDLVDASAHYILGHYLVHHKKENQALILLSKLAKSDLLWERRIAIVSTWAFIKNKNSYPTFVLCKLLLHDTEDLMHKAVGWMLREVGKHCGQETLSSFLDEYATKLPRTALRYSLEHYQEPLRSHYMKK
ncbi:MAG: DNA alkylation repair protein [Candidatus Moranbacteria bacterium]|nr:DNA alkylation repair protein [Candidatus Moranbacteria bacterium]